MAFFMLDCTAFLTPHAPVTHIETTCRTLTGSAGCVKVWIFMPNTLMRTLKPIGGKSPLNVTRFADFESNYPTENLAAVYIVFFPLDNFISFTQGKMWRKVTLHCLLIG